MTTSSRDFIFPLRARFAKDLANTSGACFDWPVWRICIDRRLKTSGQTPFRSEPPTTNETNNEIDMHSYRCSAFLSGAALAETITFDDVKRGTAADGQRRKRQRSANGLWRKMDSAPSKPNVLKQSGRQRSPLFQERPNLKDGFVE